MVASFQINANSRIWVEAKINSKDLKRDIVVIHIVVTQGNIDVDSVEIFVFDKQFFCKFQSLPQNASADSAVQPYTADLRSMKLVVHANSLSHSRRRASALS